jgi:hypothetical protein
VATNDLLLAARNARSVAAVVVARSVDSIKMIDVHIRSSRIHSAAAASLAAVLLGVSFWHVYHQAE